ncbi:hypothetical protein KEM55_008002 [Ascosphaera atra]|nr:hypothetical protein KEM55_008002 [Ascosphaera atra]
MADIEHTTPDHSDVPGPEEKKEAHIDEKASEGAPSENFDIEKGDATAYEDEAWKVLKEYAGDDDLVLTEHDNKRLLRIIDRHLMPLMCIIYGLNYLDKTTLSYGSVMGMKEDLGLVGDNYQWLGSLFYFGYLGFELPTTRLLQYLPIAKYSAFCVMAWGATLSCFAACTNFGGAATVRFLLGVFEASVTPGFTFITGKWYTQEEQHRRVSLWFSFNGWGQIFGGIIAYGIAVGTRLHGSAIAGWKIVFIVCGLLTFCCGIYFWYLIPDNQLNARWLDKRDRALAVERVRVNKQGIGNRTFKWDQVKEALLDPMLYAYAFYGCVSNIPNGGLSNFFSQLIVGFGFSQEMSLILGLPAGAVEVITLMLNAYMCTWIGSKRLLCASFFAWISVLGSILMVALPLDKHVGRLIGYYLTLASPASFVTLLGMLSTNVSGYTKKTIFAAVYLVAYCAGNIIGPQTFRPADAPRYMPAEVVIIVAGVSTIIDSYFIWWWYWRENNKKEQIRSAPGYVKLENTEFMDITDKENPEFVYQV